MRYSGKRRLVIFLKKYNWTKRKAKEVMKTGDLNAYINHLQQLQATRKQLLTYSKN